MKEAFLYERLDRGRVRCRLCSHYCLIGQGRRGICGVRENREGRLFSLVWGRPVAQNIDPIEKKPLFHFLPGSRSFSIATVGCNLSCRHCQNADIAQLPKDRTELFDGLKLKEVEPALVAAAAEEAGCASIAYTYTEPTVFGEYVYDIGLLARERGIKNVLVTNGYLSPEAVDKLGGLTDGANVDLKAFRDEFYRRVCGARLEPVLEAIMGLKERGVWLELTTLIIPGLNDSQEELTELVEWIAANPGPATPWHVSRFHPDYKLLDSTPTPTASLVRALEIGREAGLEFIYLGNVPGRGGEETSCPGCGRVLIQRTGFRVETNRLQNGACPDCGNRIEGVF